MTSVSRALPLLVSAVVLTATGTAIPAAERETYSISAVAIQDGNQVLITVKVFRNKTDGNTVLLSAPKVLLNDGCCGMVSVGTGMAPPVGPKDGPDGPAIWEGLRAEFIKAVGQDHVVCVLTVFSKGQVVSAKAETVKVTPGRFEIQGSTTSPRPATRPRRESKVTPGEAILPRSKGG
jgi:hypothetical protein